MWFLLVTTIASAILADAGYLYNAPQVPANLHHHQTAKIPRGHNTRPQDIKIVQGIQEEDKSISYSISYKDYVYLKKDNGVNYNAHPYQSSPNYNNVQVHGNIASLGNGNYASQNVHTNVVHSNNGYVGYTQPLPISYNNHYVQSYLVPTTNAQSQQHHAVAHNNHVDTNIGYAQINRSPASGSYSNNYVQTAPIGVQHNTGYVQTTAPNILNYNNYPQTSSNSVTNLNNAYAQTLTPTGSSNLNNGYVSATAATGNNRYAQPQTPQSTVYLNNEYSQTSQANAPLNNRYSPTAQQHVPSNIGYSHSGQTGTTSDNGYSHVAQGNTPLNNGYSQSVQINTPLNNGYSQGAISSEGAHLNSDYSHNFAPSSSPSYESNNGYTHTVSTSGNTNLNTRYAHASAPSIVTNLNNGYDHNLPSTGSANVNTAYDTASTSAGANGNNALTPSLISTAGGSSSAGYSSVSTGTSYIDLNTGTSQPIASSDLDNSITQNLPSASDNLNNGLANSLNQNNYNVEINPSPVSPPVTPIIHKHIYFHVPPPEIEEPVRPVPPPPQPKKNYKILFIKVPSQESKSNLILLQQQIAQMQNAAVEDKTLIYVLVKNPEDPKTVVLPPPKPSEHEVFFVKYGGNPFDIASQVNDELDQTGSVKSIVPLEPGLINGQQK